MASQKSKKSKLLSVEKHEKKSTAAKRNVTEDMNILKLYFVTFTFVFSIWLEMDRPVAKFCSMWCAIL